MIFPSGHRHYCSITGGYATSRDQAMELLLHRLDPHCWGLLGAGMGVVGLLGGRVREQIPLTALISRSDSDTRDYPTSFADATEQAVSEHGFTAVKLKGNTDARADVRTMEALRERLPVVKLRVDPNAAWSVSESVGAGHALEPLGLEYLEGPGQGLEQMSRVADPAVPDMCVARWEHLAPAVRLNAAQVIHGDVYTRAGIADHEAPRGALRRLRPGHEPAPQGRTWHVHHRPPRRRRERPALSRTIDSVYYLHDDDTIVPPPFEKGCLHVPHGVGLGVEVDEDKLAHYSALYARVHS